MEQFMNHFASKWIFPRPFLVKLADMGKLQKMYPIVKNNMMIYVNGINNETDKVFAHLFPKFLLFFSSSSIVICTILYDHNDGHVYYVSCAVRSYILLIFDPFIKGKYLL